MISLGQAVGLGFLQGLTEFLPVSSSGHLVLGQRLLGLTEPELLFDVAVHAGTLLAVVAVFWRDLWDMLRGLWDPAGPGRRLIWLVVAGSIPTAILGLAARDFFERMFSSLAAVGIALLLTGALVWVTRYLPRGHRDLNRTGAGRAFWVGLAQGLAITPGLSRSGTTISVGLMLGLERRLAAHYSFLLSIPAVGGALLLQGREAILAGGAPLTPLVVGGLAAAVSGYGALRLLLGVVQAGRLHLFAPYCWLLGLTALIWHFM